MAMANVSATGITVLYEPEEARVDVEYGFMRFLSRSILLSALTWLAT
jgi:hypothetical protein